MSYRKRYIKSKINRIKPKRSIFTRPIFWIVILILAIVSSAIYFLLFYSGVQVRDIVVSGNQKVASEDITNLISGDINNEFLSIGAWALDSKSIFLINSDELEKKLSDKFPGIESIKVSRKFFQTIEVNIAERASVAVFCSSSDENDCFLIDQNGIIFEPIATAQEVDILRLSKGECCKMSIVRQAEAISQISEGKVVVEKNIMDLILKVEKSLKDNFQIDIKEALVRSLVRLDVDTSENWKIYFDTSSDVDLQITKLNLLLSSEISESQRKNLRYINLIPNSKAIICDNETCGG